MNKELLINRWQTPDGYILESKHVHDYVTHRDANGDIYFVDGGADYIRHSVNDEPLKNMCLYTTDSIEEIREHLIRFSADGPILLKDMTPEHLVACVRYNEERGLGLDKMTFQYMRELVYRYENGLV